MRAKDLIFNDVTVYVDMDGVLADLFNHVGAIHDVEHYNKMTQSQWEEFFKNSNAYELFKDLPAFSTANKLLQLVKDIAGGYTILSSPLNFDKAGSIKGKKEWLQKNIHVKANNMIFDHEKYKYATSNGKPNILIDDYGVNIRAWQQAGGIAIKYQADEDSLKKILDGLKDAKEILSNPATEDYAVEGRKKKRRSRWAAYGPGPYGYYGTAVGYSGDGGVGGDGGGESIEQEGWRDWVAGAALGAAALGASPDAEAGKIKNQQFSKPAAVQQVKKPIKKIDPLKAISKKDVAKSVTGNAHEVYLKKAAEKAGIKDNELVAFLSQCAHETMDFKHMKEIGGSLDFRKYDPKYAPKKAKVLGNTKVGDGAKYKGRGYIQITGRYNYKKAGEALGLPLEQKPELVERPDIAAKVAVWYWKERVRDKVDSFKNTKDVTKGINPGLKHLDQRKEKQQAFQIAMK